MPTPTYTPLATVTLGSSASSVTFSSIPATYRDLILVEQSKLSGTSYTVVRFNGDTASNYANVNMRGNGSTAASSSNTDNQMYPFFFLNQSSSEFAVMLYQIMDYSATDKHKTMLTRGNVSSIATAAGAHRWASTSALTSIELRVQDGSFVAGSTFNLYGVIA